MLVEVDPARGVLTVHRSLVGPAWAVRGIRLAGRSWRTLINPTGGLRWRGDHDLGAHHGGCAPVALGSAGSRSGITPTRSGGSGARLRAVPAGPPAAPRRLGKPLAALARLLVAVRPRGNRCRAGRGLDARRGRARRSRLPERLRSHRHGAGLPGRAGREPNHEAVAYVQEHYAPGAVETPWQRRFVSRFQ